MMQTGSTVDVARQEPREFHLGWAVGISLLAHLLFVVFTVWIPLDDRVQAAAPPQNQVLQFTFAPPEAPQVERPEPARGEVPFATPPPSAPVPPAVPPPEQRQPPETRQEEPPAHATPETEEPGTRLPDTPDATLTRGEEADPTRPATEQERALDLTSALGKFQRTIDRSRAARPPQQPGAGTRQNVFTPSDLGPMPVQGAPYGILEFTSRDYDWSDYASQIYWEILRAWYNRLYVTAPDFEKWAFNNRSWMLDHRSGIRFVIERNGDVTGIELRAPAGCPPLDASALDALAEVILPPLPADFPRDREEVRATFIATGDIRFMRTTLGQLKAAGYF